MHNNQLSITYNQLSISGFSKKLNLMFILFFLTAIYISGSLKNYVQKYTLQCQLCRGRLTNIIYEFAKLCALHAFVPYLPSCLRAFVPSHLRAFAPYAPSCLMCLRALRALIFTRLNYPLCAPYLLFARLTHSRYKISF